MNPTPLTELDKLKEQLLFEEQYDKGLKELHRNREVWEEYKKEKELQKFIKNRNKFSKK